MSTPALPRSGRITFQCSRGDGTHESIPGWYEIDQNGNWTMKLLDIGLCAVVKIYT